MGSYCPICDEFVDNLDHCELPYGGAPAPNYNKMRTQVDYSDIAFESPPVSPRTLEANMSYNLMKTGNNTVNVDNILWEIDVDSTETGLLRQNAMTVYEPLNNYLVLARGFQTMKKIFYLVKVKGHQQGWVQISIEEGDNIYNISPR